MIFCFRCKVHHPEEVKSTDEPLKRNSCFPAGKGCKIIQNASVYGLSRTGSQYPRFTVNCIRTYRKTKSLRIHYEDCIPKPYILFTITQSYRLDLLQGADIGECLSTVYSFEIPFLVFSCSLFFDIIRVVVILDDTVIRFRFCSNAD